MVKIILYIDLTNSIDLTYDNNNSNNNNKNIVLILLIIVFITIIINIFKNLCEMEHKKVDYIIK